MSNPIIRIHDIQTDTIIDREMTDDEFKIYQGQIEDKTGVEY
jgi:hypothetical protein